MQRWILVAHRLLPHRCAVSWRPSSAPSLRYIRFGGCLRQNASEAPRDPTPPVAGAVRSRHYKPRRPGRNIGHRAVSLSASSVPGSRPSPEPDRRAGVAAVTSCLGTCSIPATSPSKGMGAKAPDADSPLPVPRYRAQEARPATTGCLAVQCESHAASSSPSRNMPIRTHPPG